ncbi:MAG TPA: TPM domain-containing protein [Candidatus Binatia bacterium]|nr:TPM domain-containing protein [Candidatus Binatia bacterium]
MKILAALALFAGLAGAALPALARDSYVMDGASMFSAATVSALNAKIGDFNRQTGKEVVVVTVPSLGGRTPQDAAERAFAQNQVNGVMIFMAKAEKIDGIVPDRAASRFFPPGETQSIRQAMRGYFRSGDFDAGIATGVDLVLGQYRSHLGTVRHSESSGQTVPSVPSTSTARTGGFNMGWIWLILIAIAAFLIIRALFRAIAGPRMSPPGYGGPGMGPGMGPGYGGAGYGGGGGSFWSGLLGGLGGAFLGNELFGRGGLGGGEVGSAGVVPGDAGASQDAQGWQGDAGQADMSNSSFGDYGGSGGGFDAGGGGGFDSGGGGDGGGGW